MQSFQTIIENYLKNEPLYVVGGAIRDRILKRYSSDIDIVVPSDVHEVALSFARKSGGTYILLDDEPHRKTERVVIKSHDEIFVFDFAEMLGTSIEEDLEKRDFTINAIALSLKDYLEGRFDLLIDPFGGQDDIREKKIVVLTDESFRDDPLRMLRAFRFAGQLDFEIDKKTRESIVRNYGRLKEVSWERIRDEFFKILSLSSCIPFIVDMDGLGLLEVIFPEILSMKGVHQNGYHHLDVWEHTLLTLENVEGVIKNPEDYFAGYSLKLKEYLDSESVSGRSKESVIKLATLLHDSGKPETVSKDVDGRVRFLGHENAGKLIAEKVARRLRLSNREVGFVKDLVGDHMYLLNFSFLNSLSQKGILRFFRKHPEEFWAYFILFLADSMAALGPDVPDDRMPKIKKMTREMLDKYYHGFKPRAEKPRLITGKDLIDEFDLQPGPFFGIILAKVEEAQMEGSIKNREEAIRYVEKIMESDVKKWLKEDGEIFLKSIGVEAGQVILDYGCGAGHYTIPAAKIVGREGKVYAIDRDDDTLDRLMWAAEAEGLKNIVPIETSEESKIDLEDDSVDVALLYDVLHFMDIDERRKLYSMVHRILKTGALLSVYPKHHKLDEPLWKFSDMRLEDVIKEIEMANFYLDGKDHKRLIHDDNYDSGYILSFTKK